jgi:hypothetical protein
VVTDYLNPGTVMRQAFAAAVLALLAPAVAAAQSADIGVSGVGVSIGNSAEWTGLRLNIRDDGVRRVDGVNITLWKPGRNPEFRMNGVALGVVGPGVGTLNGIGAGLGGVVSNGAINGAVLGGLGAVAGGPVTGVAVGGLGVVTDGPATGIMAGGLGIVSEGALTGLGVAGLGAVTDGLTGVTVAGLGAVSGGDVRGVTVAGLGAVSGGDVRGVTVAGLGVVVGGALSGISVAGLAAVAEGRMAGLNTAGLALVGEAGVYGINTAGLAVVATGPVVGITKTLGAVESRELVRGFTAAGYRVRSPRVEGIAAAVGTVRTDHLRGLGIAGYNDVRGVQVGVTIGVYNSAEILNGIQIGVLNRAKNNRPPFRWLPILNVHL